MDDRHLANPSPCYRDEWGIILSIDNVSFLLFERERHQSADKHGKRTCQQCGFCCLRKPCIPTPDEVKVIADYLRVSVSELITTKMVADVRGNHDRNEHYLIWAQETQADLLGKLLPYNRTYDRGYCIFFDRITHNCLIHPVRPVTAKMSKCWAKNKRGITFNEKETWSTEIIKAMCPSISLEEDREGDEDDADDTE